MEKAFITGRGLITPLGTTLAVNEEGLRSGRSGIVQVPEFVEHQLESMVGGMANEKPECELVDRKKMRFCPPTALMSIVTVLEALKEADIPLESLNEHRIALIGGVAGSNNREIYEETCTYVNNGFKLRGVSPYAVPRVMPSSAVSNLSLTLGLTGESYDVSAACASSAIAIMVGTRLIRSGMYDMVIAGGAEQIDWVQALGFCACRALSKKYNDTPWRASRPFDKGRDGFVLAAGSAWVVLESGSSVAKRKARAITEVSGVCSNSNAKDMVVPDSKSSSEVIAGALRDAGLRAGDIGYVNTHGTGTPVGDPIELAAIRDVLGSSVAINSTKSQTGHMVGATGAAEVIFSSMMMERNFISPSINLEEPDDEFSWADLVRECRTGTRVKHALSNSFAFGGSNIGLVLSDCGN